MKDYEKLNNLSKEEIEMLGEEYVKGLKANIKFFEEKLEGNRKFLSYMKPEEQDEFINASLFA